MGYRRNNGSNERLYPICFFVLLPLIGFSAAYEYNFMNGDTSSGLLAGLLAGVGSYLFYKLFSK